MAFSDPKKNCKLCPRLHSLRISNKENFPDFFNAPVPAFGPIKAALLIIGLAPGFKGANRTGRPFTGDFAGTVLYPTLIKSGLAVGCYEASSHDNIKLIECRITNAVRCVPPQNKPIGSEIASCRSFLRNEIHAMPNIRGLLALGIVAHNSALTALGIKQNAYRFSHGVFHQISPNFWLGNSYHCSRYNINTKRLTIKMFEKVLLEAAKRTKRA